MDRNQLNEQIPAAAVDLFCGIGGMTHGFLQEGVRVVAGVDSDATCRYAYEKNNNARFICADVNSVKTTELAALFPPNEFRILAACAPCQPYSLYANRPSPDGKWKLLRTFARIAIGIKPDILAMENVPRIKRHSVFDELVSRLEARGYTVTHFIARGPDYGIPQRRDRLLLFASLYGPVAIVDPTHPDRDGTSLRDAIGNLGPISAGAAADADALHRCRGVSAINLERLRATPPGGGWRDWPESLRLTCHKKKSGQTFRSVYGRMTWDKPASVLTTQFIGIGNGRFGHPDQDRALSLREGALIQTFPMGYEFLDPSAKHVSLRTLARHIGNAVPVVLGRIVARSIRHHLENLIGA